MVSRGANVVSACAPEAVGAGLTVLAAGGNAFDAVVAACLVEGVALPMKCGLGGDLIALVHRPGMSREVFQSVGKGIRALDAGPGTLTEVGVRSIGVPGAAAGYAQLAGLGRYSLADLASFGVRAARDGVAWSAIGVQLTFEARALLDQNGSSPFLPGGDLPRVGDVLRLQGLSELIKEFGHSGADLFKGPVGTVIADAIQRRGGLLDNADLHQDTFVRTRPDSLRLEKNDVVLEVTPLPTHGPALARALSLVLDSGWSALQACGEARGGRAPTREGTSVVTAADEDGNAAVVVHSNSYPQYGSGVVVAPFDLVLNNRPGRGFDRDADASMPNAPLPGRIPDTTLHAWCIEDHRNLYLGATPGGENQMVWNLQAVVELVGQGSPLNSIVVSPRWGWDRAGLVLRESDLRGEVGPDERVISPLGHRSAQQILHLREQGSPIVVAADPRIGARTGAIAKWKPQGSGDNVL